MGSVAGTAVGTPRAAGAVTVRGVGTGATARTLAPTHTDLATNANDHSHCASEEVGSDPLIEPLN